MIAWWHKHVLKHHQDVHSSRLYDGRDFKFCSCGQVFDP